MASACTGPLHAEELIFHNGDRLSGEVVSQTDEIIVFDAPMVGRIEVSTADVKLGSSIPVPELAAIAPVVVESDAQEAATAEQAAPAVPPQAPDASPKAKVAAKITPWSGSVELGFRQEQGRKDSINIDLRATAERTYGVNTFKANTRILRGEQDNVVNKSRYDGSFRWRRELGERTFAQSLSSYYRDDLKNITDNWEQNIGAGYRLFKSDDHAVNIGGGLTAQYRNEESLDGNFYTLIELFQDYSYQISKRIKFVQDAVAQYSPDGRSRFVTVANQPTPTTEDLPNYKVRFNTALQGQITERIQINLRYEYEFDNAVSTSDAKTDQRITSSIGYGF
ncbi:DUF481 domain-containing protein [Synoicihabitans lomoniglobus]|uniref:DUF481 domain-containing protein n=1 Tax=Synoicihabitans lomoniglobus TaxID=2909285 RepID=UPI002ED18596|nr:DUF481 domain-containing protein [Opitutaceae bacterium LMO-M01]